MQRKERRACCWVRKMISVRFCDKYSEKESPVKVEPLVER
jgi:hypothetical protein